MKAHFAGGTSRVVNGTRLSISLGIIAIVNGLLGSLGIVHVARELIHSHLDLNLGLLLLPAGIGIWQRRPGWRTVVLAVSWLGLLFGIGSLILMARTTFWGGEIKTAFQNPWLDVGVIFAFLAYSVWQIRVLHTPKVKEMFGMGREGTAPRSRERDYLCPVCGYDYGLPGLKTSAPAAERCPCCGVPFLEDGNGTPHPPPPKADYQAWRKQWIVEGMLWKDPKVLPPENWDPAMQLIRSRRLG